MKINKKFDININISINNLQNNQRKENLKRTMFTKSSNSIVLKKSGEIMINTQIKNDIIFISPVSSPRIKFDSLIIPTINTNHINKFAQYNKINLNKLYYRETMDCKYYKFELMEKCVYLKNFVTNRYKEGVYNEIFLRDYFNCITSIQRGMQYHIVVTEIIDQTDESITFSYYVITTNKNIVDYGGGNKFKPLFLYFDEVSGKNFYTIPLLCLDRVPKTEFDNLYSIKKKEDFKDSYDLQKKIVDNIIRLEEDQTICFKQFHIRDDFLEKEIRYINFSILFKDKDTKYVTKPWVDSVFN